jgi:hypothetical protein
MDVRSRARHVTCSAAAALLAAVVGCGGPGGVPVTAKVTASGAPVADAVVTFHGKASYSGKTASDGTATIRGGGGAGPEPGTYKVTVVKQELRKGAKVPAGMESDPTQLQAMGLTVNAFPPQYAEPTQTPLTAEVKSGGGSFTFDVKPD